MMESLKKVLMILTPVAAALSLIGLSQAVDPLASEACKALSVISVLGCLSLAASGGRRSFVKLGTMDSSAVQQKARRAA